MAVYSAGCVATAGAAEPRIGSFRELGPAELDARAKRDAVLLASYARGIESLIAELERRRDLFERGGQTPLDPDERELALSLFEHVVDYSVALDQMAVFHFEFWRVDIIRQPIRHARHFAVAFAAYCLMVRLGLQFADFTLNRPQFEKLLDEGSPEHGLPPGMYGHLKWNVVHVEVISRILAAHQYHKILKRTAYHEFSGELAMPPVLRVLDDSYDRVKQRLLGAGVKLFAGNALDILRDSGQKAWFPVQQNVAELMGDTKVRRLHTMLISEEQVREAARMSRPGDILVERRNWYLSNVALPGFWPHAALWIGTAEEMAELLDLEPEVRAEYGGPLTEALAKRYPEAWADFTSLDEEGHRHRVIEAMSEGVVFTSAEHSVRADYVASMRPRLSPLEIARAIERAFGYAGRPYDFDFDFYTDTSLVCSELVYKAFEPREEARGLTFQLESIVGRMTLGPNSMVRQFERDYGSLRQQLDFVWFLDGREKQRDAVWGDVQDFLASHRRFKWDIAQK
jgi:hypothetical protein